MTLDPKALEAAARAICVNPDEVTMGSRSTGSTESETIVYRPAWQNVLPIAQAAITAYLAALASSPPISAKWVEQADVMPKSRTRPWGVHTINDMIAPKSVAIGLPDGRWVRAVPEPYYVLGLLERLTAAWWVMTHRAFAVQWPQPGDLERVLEGDQP